MYVRSFVLHALIFLCWLGVSLPADAEHGLLSRVVPVTVDEAADKIEATAKARGLTVFARVDHAKNAQAVGLVMPPTIVLLLGNPKGGTPVMLAAPSSAIDLPLHVLIWKAGDGTTHIAHWSPETLKERHAIPESLGKNISGLAALLDATFK
jgi:uncharacterized protein (DUF302 family)